MHLAQRCSNADGDAQEAFDFHRWAEKSAEQLPAGILEHQNALTAMSREFERPHGPGAVQLILERVFVGKAIDSRRSRLFRSREYDQDVFASIARAFAPRSAENESSVLGQNLEAIHSVRREP